MLKLFSGLAFIAALIYGISSVRAATGPLPDKLPCAHEAKSLPQIIEGILAIDGIRQLSFNGERANKIMVLLNKKEPETHWSADRIVFLYKNGEERGFIFFMDGKCLDAMTVPKVDFLKDVMEAVGDET